MKRNILSITCLGLWLAAGLSLKANSFRHLSTVHDGVGSMSTNTVLLNGIAYRQVGAGAQPGGIMTGTNAPWVHHAGFLQAVDLKRPALDTDGDGVPDELDTDNDNDYLADLQEVTGSAFDPTTSTEVNDADTDDDGVQDGQEAVAGTDPQDPDAFLHITSIGKPDDSPAIQWLARQGKIYNIQKADGPYQQPNTSLGTSTGGLGSGPWFVVTNVFTDASGTAEGRYYSVQTPP